MIFKTFFPSPVKFVKSEFQYLYAEVSISDFVRVRIYFSCIPWHHWTLCRCINSLHSKTSLVNNIFHKKYFILFFFYPSFHFLHTLYEKIRYNKPIINNTARRRYKAPMVFNEQVLFRDPEFVFVPLVMIYKHPLM